MSLDRSKTIRTLTDVRAIGSLMAEYAWLLAAISVPVAFEPQASFHFIPIKSLLFQFTGLICWMAIAMALGGDLGLRPGKSWAKTHSRCVPVFFAAVSFLVVIGISSWLSVDVSRSWVSRTMVSFSFAARLPEVGLCLAVAVFLRTDAQWQRLVTVLLLSSLPVALLALVELYGFAPAHFAGRRYGLTSFAGGPIFLGGYLIMLMPLCLWKLQNRLRTQNGRFDVPAILYASLLGLQFIAFLGTGKRGPLVAFIGSGVTGIVLFAWIYGQITWIRRAIFGGGLVFAALVVLALLQKSHATFEAVPWVEKLSRIVPVGSGTGDTFRDSLWQAVPRLIFSTEHVSMSAGRTDLPFPGRWLFGFGPDTVRAVLPSEWIWLPAWPATLLEVSCHSLFWDSFLTTGFLGTAALFWLVFEFIFSGVGKSVAPRFKLRRLPAFGASLAGGCVGGFVLTLLFHVGYFGLGFSLGFIFGIPALLLLGTRRTTKDHKKIPAGYSLPAIALVTGLTAHWIDMAFVFPTANTNFLFWIFGGMLVALRPGSKERTHTLDASVEPVSSIGKTSWTIVPLLGAVLAAMLVHALIEIPDWPGSARDLWILLGVVFLPTCAISSWWSANELARRNRSGFLVLAPISTAITYSLIRWILPMDVDLWIPLLLLAAVLVLSLCLSQTSLAPKLIAVSAVFLALLWTIIGTNGRAIRAESHIHSAQHAQNSGSNDAAVTFYRKALILDPGNTLTRANLIRVLTTSSENERLQVLTDGLAVSRFNELNRCVADIYLNRAMSATVPEERIRAGLHARYAYARAMQYNPQDEIACFNSSILEREIFEDPDRANILEARANEITDRDFDAKISANLAAWGVHYAEKFHTSSDSPLGKYYHSRALDYLNRAIPEAYAVLQKQKLPVQVRADVLRELFWCVLHRGNLEKYSGRTFAASLDYLAASRIQPEDVSWSVSEPVDFTKIDLLQNTLQLRRSVFPNQPRGK